jgi:hypothetical protein
MKVRVTPFERRRIDRCSQLVHFVPTDAGASHAGVDLDMEGAVATRRPFENAAGVAQRRRQLIAIVCVEQIGASR